MIITERVELWSQEGFDGMLARAIKRAEDAGYESPVLKLLPVSVGSVKDFSTWEFSFKVGENGES